MEKVLVQQSHARVPRSHLVRVRVRVRVRFRVRFRVRVTQTSEGG